MKALSVTTSGPTLTLDGGVGALTASVANQEPTQQRVVVVAVPQAPGPDGAVERTPREIAAGQTEQFLVSFSAAAVEPGTYRSRIVAYPSDEAPEEYAAYGQPVELVVPGGAEPPPVRVRRFPWWIVAVVAAVVVIGAVAAFLLLRPSTVAVPDVSGLTSAEAQSSLAEAGLTARTQNVFSTQPIGTVVSQDPAAGSEVEVGSDVVVSVARGPLVPSFTFTLGSLLTDFPIASP